MVVKNEKFGITLWQNGKQIGVDKRGGLLIFRMSTVELRMFRKRWITVMEPERVMA